MSRYMPKTTEQGKTKIFYIDFSNPSRKILKVLASTTLISDLPQILLKDSNVDFSNINVYVNDGLIDDTDVQISVISGGTVRFEIKPQTFSKFYTKKDLEGKEIAVTNTSEKDFYNSLDIDPESNKIIFYNEDGKEVQINDEDFNQTFEKNKEFSVINYPIVLEEKKKEENKKEFFETIMNDLGIEIGEFTHFLCVLYILDNDKNIKEKVFSGLAKKRSFKELTKKLIEDIEDSLSKSENYLPFIFSIPMLKSQRKTYPQVIETWHGKEEGKNPFAVVDIGSFIFDKNVDPGTILCISADQYGIYEGDMQYLDIIDHQTKPVSIDYSQIKDPSQITAIFVDTSGSMRAVFKEEYLFEAASKIAKELINKIVQSDIIDPLFVFTSQNMITDRKLQIKKEDTNGSTFIWMKLVEMLEEIKNKKNDRKNCPCHIVIISDGENTNDTVKKEEVFKEIVKENVVVDSIILSNNEFTEDPYKFSTFTSGVFIYPNSVEEAIKFISKESFFDMSLRNDMKILYQPKNPFDEIDEKPNNFLQISDMQNIPKFYHAYKFGILKPSIKEVRQAKTYPDPFNEQLIQCLDDDNENENYYVFLIKNSLEKDDPAELVKHWCVFVKMNNSFFYQLQIDFNDNYPYSRPQMRIVSHPELFGKNDIIDSIYGKINYKKLIDGLDKFPSVDQLLKNLIKLTSEIEIDELKGCFDQNDSFDKLENSLFIKFNSKFEDGWNEGTDFMKTITSGK